MRVKSDTYRAFYHLSWRCPSERLCKLHAKPQGYKYIFLKGHGPRYDICCSWDSWHWQQNTGLFKKVLEPEDPNANTLMTVGQPKSWTMGPAYSPVSWRMWEYGSKSHALAIHSRMDTCAGWPHSPKASLVHPVKSWLDYRSILHAIPVWTSLSKTDGSRGPLPPHFNPRPPPICASNPIDSKGAKTELSLRIRASYF